jgi:hypothetical protein
VFTQSKPQRTEVKPQTVLLRDGRLLMLEVAQMDEEVRLDFVDPVQRERKTALFLNLADLSDAERVSRLNWITVCGEFRGLILKGAASCSFGSAVHPVCSPFSSKIYKLLPYPRLPSHFQTYANSIAGGRRWS